MSEAAVIAAELDPPFLVAEPAEAACPFVFCSPHSGRTYPSVLLDRSRLDPLTLRTSEDCYVETLFSGVARLGAPLLAARFPRAYVDVNREPYELDPELFTGQLPTYANTRSVRVAGGLGTIARVVSDQAPIYRQKLPVEVGLERIEMLYKPFHRELARLLERTKAEFGIAVLIDCHSMPSASMTSQGGRRPDIVVGDRFGSSCDARITRTLCDALRGQGLTVQLNRPYAGGFITEHYGRPFQGFHAIQVEINRGLYMNEATLEPTARFDGLREQLDRVAAQVFVDVPAALSRRSAAE